jgi:hypothetical protein
MAISFRTTSRRVRLTGALQPRQDHITCGGTPFFARCGLVAAHVCKVSDRLATDGGQLLCDCAEQLFWPLALQAPKPECFHSPGSARLRLLSMRFPEPTWLQNGLWTFRQSSWAPCEPGIVAATCLAANLVSHCKGPKWTDGSQSSYDSKIWLGDS